MTESEDEAAAWREPDAQPFTPEELARTKRIPRARTLRRALGLTQEEFAARYRIPLGTLRDWEQGRSEPDQPPLPRRPGAGRQERRPQGAFGKGRALRLEFGRSFCGSGHP